MTRTNTARGHRSGDVGHWCPVPLLAAVGAGDIAAHTVVDTVAYFVHSSRPLPGDWVVWGSKLGRTELRKTAEGYAHAARQTYDHLAHRGGARLDALRSQLLVQRAEAVVDQARSLGDNALGILARTFRLAGANAAWVPERAATDLAGTVEPDGHRTAQTAGDRGLRAARGTRSATRKTANRTQAAQRATQATTLGSGPQQPRAAKLKSAPKPPTPAAHTRRRSQGSGKTS
jgi:heparin binding hemagglutinin HbhA